MLIGADARAVRPYMRTRARHISHFTYRLGHDRYVGTHGSCVRSHGKESLYTRLQEQTHMFIGADARAVRPYIRLSGSSSRAQ